ncbi:MAG: S8 family serine peptidase, partial [Thermoplasmata archaeon]
MNVSKNNTHLSSLIVFISVFILIASISQIIVCANNEKDYTTMPKGVSNTDNRDDRNNNKIEDTFEEKIKTLNSTDNVNVIVTLTQRDEGFIKFSETHGAILGEFFTIIDAVSLTIPIENITKIASYPAVELLCEDGEIHTSLDTALPVQYADKKTLQAAGFDVDGSGITIAIADTGLNPEHSSIKTMPDGKTKKIIGWVDVINGKTTPYDNDWGGAHGTRCGIIAAGIGTGSPSFSLIGVAPWAKLVGVKTMRDGGSTLDTDLLKATQWVLDHRIEYGINVFSMSLGGGGGQRDGNTALDKAIEKIVSAGVSCVVAAGNSGPSPNTILVPGCNRKTITVGGVGSDYVILDRSSRGPTADGRIKPDICTIGVVRMPDGSGGVSTHMGTSFACPQASGAVALILQYHSKLLDKYDTPTLKSSIVLSPDMIKDILMKSTIQPSSGGPYPNNNYGNGVMNVKGALTMLKNKNYIPMAKFAVSGAQSTDSPITFDASGSIDPNGDTLIYSWNFGDGTTGTGKTVNHTYSNAGSCTVSLTVKDSKNNANDFGASSTIINQLITTTKSLNIVTGNKLPVPSITANGVNVNRNYILNFSAGEQISLDASKSTDPDGQV